MVNDLSAPIRLMVVDDSAIIRGLLQRAVKEQPDIEIVATASNGQLAIDRLKTIPADVITLDVEMPLMDGITALPELLKTSPTTRIIMISTLTQRNAAISLKAMELGASDYLAKPSSQTENEVKEFFAEFLAKVRALAPRKRRLILDGMETKPAQPQAATPVAKASTSHIVIPPTTYPKLPVRALAIGSSTGGPQALATVFKGLATKFPNVPVFVTQHMPPTFTTILAEHIKQVSGRPCAEGIDGEEVKAGSVYIAPGNYHMQPEKIDGKVVIKLNQNPQVNFCRPAVDPMLHSLTQIYGTGLLSVILTGMGSDGAEGCKEVAAAAGTVVAQNEATCVVWGMPRAVTEANVCSAVLPLEDIAAYIQKACP